MCGVEQLGNGAARPGIEPSVAHGLAVLIRSEALVERGVATPERLAADGRQASFFRDVYPVACPAAAGERGLTDQQNAARPAIGRTAGGVAQFATPAKVSFSIVRE